MVKRLQHVTDELVDDIFGVEWKSIRERAILLVQGGNYDLKQVEARNVGSTVSEDAQDLVLIRCPCYGSERDVEHMVHMCFRDVGDGGLGSFMVSPFSSCGCEDGDLFCSHMLGWLLVLSLIQLMLQEDPGITESAFVDMMPEHPRIIQSRPILVEWLWRRMKFKISKAATQREKRKKLLPLL